MNEKINKADIAQLIKMVREDDEEAFELLLAKYRPLIESALDRFCGTELAKPHREDLRQEATLVFYNAILNYDLDNEDVEFGLYAKICVNNALISQIRRLSKKCAEQLFEDTDEKDASLTEEPSSKIIEIESFERLDSVIRKNLSELEYRVWYRYASGQTAREIGKALGKSEKSVSNAIYRIRKKLREVLA